MIYFIFPVYNERDNIEALIRGIRALMQAKGLPYRMVAVNDGSTDGSLDILKSLQQDDLLVASSIVNMNVGAVFSTGLMRVMEEAKDHDTVFILESDQTSELDCILPMAEKVGDGEDIVIASRYAPGGKYVGFPWQRTVFSFCANALIRGFFPIKGAVDYTIFFRAYRAGVIRRAVEHFGPFGLIQSQGFTANAELLIKLSFFTTRISEVPLVYNYGKKKGKSKINIMGTISGYFFLISYLKQIARKMRRLEGAAR